VPKVELLVVQPTPFCNINCRYCYLPDRNSRVVVAQQTLINLFSQVFASGWVQDCLSVVWHAGEPMVLPIGFYCDAFRANAARNRVLARPWRRGSGELTLVLASFALPILPSLLAACLVILVGGILAHRVPLLARYSIPAPIVGGLIFAVLALLAERTIGVGIAFDTSAKTPFLLPFFASIGLTADLAVLRRGGVRLLRFLLALFPFLIAQDALGVVMARLLGLHPVLGLVAGSITLGGGHGTGAAYAERFAEEHDILGVMGHRTMSRRPWLGLGLPPIRSVRGVTQR
jgi:hypothetical protein